MHMMVRCHICDECCCDMCSGMASAQEDFDIDGNPVVYYTCLECTDYSEEL